MPRSIPLGEDDFFNWQAKLVDNVAKNLVLYGVNQAWFHDEVELARARYETGYKNWRDKTSRTTTITAEKDEAKALYTILLRLLVMHIKAMPHVKEALLNELGIAVGKGGGHAKPVIKTAPVLDFDVSLIRHIRFLFSETHSDSHGRPANVQGMELVGGFFSERPHRVSDMKQSWFATSSPLEIEFEEDDRGKIFYFAVRWESTAGEKGPWSMIMEIMVP